MTQKITVSDLLSQETIRDPAKFYTHLREQEPLTCVDDFLGRGKAWILTDYEDAMTVLKDPRFTKDRRKILAQEGGQSPLLEGPFLALMQNMITVDPPDHTRLRGLVSKAFTPRMIEQLRPRIQQITDELLDAVHERGEMDLINDFAYPLPITVICEMLGIPVEDRQQFRVWTQAMVNSGEKMVQEAMIVSSIETFLDYIRTLLDKKRAHPGNDLISDLVRVEEDGDMLSENELISMIFLLIVAGHETTVNLIGVGTLILLQHPDQLQRLQKDPSLIPTAVEELLRYASPVNLSDERWATEDIPMYGKVIRKGEIVYASLIGANTDRQQFHNPEELDIARRENQHLAFGKGIHYCLGAPLARLEGQIAFDTLIRRMPNLRLACDAEQLVWNNNPMLRGLRSLPVTF
ncbi:MAG: cytochrome P450 [Ktedonobacteraceae bacterium]|nr:cytochrome P450 [Ktedonobacteraceae bacterium]